MVNPRSRGGRGFTPPSGKHDLLQMLLMRVAILLTDFLNICPMYALIPFSGSYPKWGLRKGPLKAKKYDFGKIQNGQWWTYSSLDKKSRKLKSSVSMS